ncbi:unnamed protein product [Phyllotreta striolata]|uniref:Uncharacterized protein n=1 Tax=Phyllotreta striolata TaxID=444603 RepID=A0A9P0DKT4_PHYSR|nr:unnamed protein product [Phyllotreta striolata]
MEEGSSASKPNEIKHREVQFYDSDEEFGFGPMTLREAKARLRKPLESHTFTIPSVRHTVYQLLDNSESSNMPNTDQFEKDDSIPTISSYLTSSEGANEQLNMNNSGSTNYYSIVESNAEKSFLDLSTKDTEIPEAPVNQPVNETLAMLIQKVQDQTYVELENEHLTLINHTIESLPDDSEESDDSDLAQVINLSSDEGNLTQTDECKEDSDELIASTSSTEDFSVPDIDLQQFNESCGLLDTTLDRINAILGQDPDPMVENEKENDSAETDTSSIQCNIISSSHLQKYKENIFEDELETPKLKPPTTAAIKSGSHKYTPEFKKPIASGLPKCISRTNPNLKDIVSPVRMYIKNSPRPVLKQNVNSTSKLPILRNTHAPTKKNKENSTVLPNVVYTPAQKQILESNESFHLPPSLDKMIKKGVVIKHVSGSRNFHPSDTLNPQAELTQNIFSNSSTASDSDVSFLHRKVTVRKD